MKRWQRRMIGTVLLAALCFPPPFAATAGDRFFAYNLIPTALTIDLCPSAGPDRAYAIGIVDQELPCLPTSLDDGLVAIPDQGAELVGA